MPSTTTTTTLQISSPGSGTGGSTVMSQPSFSRDLSPHGTSSQAPIFPHVSEEQCPGACLKLDELFFSWLTQRETVGLVDQCINLARRGQPLPGDACPETNFRGLPSPSHHPLTNQPPRSPTSSATTSALSFFKRSSPPSVDSGKSSSGMVQDSNSSSCSSSSGSSHSRENEMNGQLGLGPAADQAVGGGDAARRMSEPAGKPHVPPLLELRLRKGASPSQGKAFAQDSLVHRQAEIEALVTQLSCPSGGIRVENFGEVTKRLCGFPAFFNAPLFRRILSLYGPEAGDSSGMDTGSDSSPPVVTLDMMLRFWKEEMQPHDIVARIFRLIKQPSSPYIVKDDFQPFLRELLGSHPGLEFLRSHPDFQEKYALTVVTRIFYSVNRSGSGRITLKEFRRSRLLEALHFVDEQDDINKETSFFSYEHFYVLYCRFWELDTDRDGFLLKEDLLKYGDHSLSQPIVDRVFEVGPRPFSDGRGAKRNPDKMSYEDYIFFMLSEEDKGNEASLRYWFCCVDVDGDSIISYQEMKYFYSVQLQRMEWLGHELVPFEDVLCQMLDMLKPKNKAGALRLHDFLQPDKIKIAGVFFDAMFNLNKFIQFEQRDPFGDRQKREDPFDCEWDRFAYRDYQQLSMDEEEHEGYIDDVDNVASMEVEEGGEWGATEDFTDVENATLSLGRVGGRGEEAPF